MSLMLSPPRSSWALGQSLQTFDEYKQSERSQRRLCGTTKSGELLDYQTLAQRLQPPVVDICNSGPTGHTILTISSANRSGTLVEVVQGLTELGLEVHSARISSDGGWFVDVFEISEADGSKVTDKRKLSYIENMLDVHGAEGKIPSKTQSGEEEEEEQDNTTLLESTVFELAGPDRAGLLADITDCVSAENCHVQSAAVWTYEGRVAFVVSVTQGDGPVPAARLQHLRPLLAQIMNDNGDAIVRIWTARGEIHHERRLHQLMLLEDSRGYQASQNPEEKRLLSSSEVQAISDARTIVASEPREVQRDERRIVEAGPRFVASSPTDSVSSLHESLGLDYRSPKHSTPMVKIQRCSDRHYWLVNIECKDRNKLLFDTVCTLADMNYDVYHASIDSVRGQALQEYYIRTRQGCTEWNDAKADKLRVMLEASIQRRFPQGLKVHVRALQTGNCLTELAHRLRAANLSITRAKVRPYSKMSGQTLYLMGTDGKPPHPSVVEEACCNLGGVLVDRIVGIEGRKDALGEAKFSFSLLERQFCRGWGTGRSPSMASSFAST